MKIVVAIPTGDRVNGILKVIEKWRKACDFDIAVYTWDAETKKVVESKVDYLFEGPLQSFAINQNLMAKELDWDVFICGADDLFPDFGINLIEKVCSQNSGKVIWVKDGFLNQQPTHVIITREWYDKHGYIFDEQFEHNFCDTDLFMLARKDNEVVKCFQIGFDHRHPLKTGKKPDAIYRLGASSYAADMRRFQQKHPVNIQTEIQEVIVD